MICWILLLINLTSCVCGTFVVNVTQTSYQAEENHNITLEWTFTTNTDSSLNSLSIYCELRADHKVSVLYDLDKGGEIPLAHGEQFAGRVQCDKDVLREGRIRLHVSRLRTEDSGLYLCEVNPNHGGSLGEYRLNVTAARDWSEPERQKSPSRGRIGLYCGLGLTAAALLVVCCLLFIHCLPREQDSYSESSGGCETSYSSASGSKETIGSTV